MTQSSQKFPFFRRPFTQLEATFVQIPFEIFFLFQVLPALKSFCFFCGMGILIVYILQATWFVAWISIDQVKTILGHIYLWSMQIIFS